MAEERSASSDSCSQASVDCTTESEEDINLKLINCVCPICLEIADKAVITKCCRKVYCELHSAPIAEVRRACPSCRAQPLELDIAHTERDYIARFATKCPFCEAQCARGHIEEHKQSCQERPDPQVFSAARLYPEKYKLFH